jgi:predicted nucleotidyltransferase
MTEKPQDDPVLKRFRAAVTEIYGDRLERVVLFGSRARAMRGRIPTTT